MTKQITQVFIVADLSGSMQGALEATQREMISKTIADLATVEGLGVQEFPVTLIPFSVRAELGPTRLAGYHNWDPDVRQLTTYRSGMGGGTALRDAIGLALTTAEARAISATPALVMVFTDGEENQSSQFSTARLKSVIERLEATGNLTLTVAGPPRAAGYMSAIGVHPENFKAWDGSVTEMRQVDVATRSSVSSYVQARAAGQKSVTRFYADPSKLTAAGVKANTKTVTPTEVKVATKRMAGRSIADFYGSAFEPGTHYYELVKAEYIQEDKELVLLIKDQNEYRLGSRAVRSLMGLPETGKIRLHPAPDTGNFRVFVQSSSNNRKVVEGQTFLTIKD